MSARLYNTLRYVLVVVCGLVLAIPLLFMVSGSLKSAREINAFPQPLLPETPVWQNFVDA